jgi:DNA-binding GntR family transcriptional regulator
MDVITRVSTTGAVADRLRTMIADAELQPGERINEVHLARELGVSRTPLREALARLAPEGAVGHSPHIGYFVKPLTLDEFEAIYAMRAILDPAALDAAGVPSALRIAELWALNGQLEASTDVTDTLNLDDAWHRELVAGCPNFILLELIEHFMLRTRRYEVALMRERPQVAAAVEQHRRILRALEQNDLAGACAALRDNMTRGAEPMRAWLEARAAADGRD